MAKDEDKCSVKNCGRESVIIYLGKGLCDKHWGIQCGEEPAIKTTKPKPKDL